MLVDQQALVEIGLALFFEFGDRIGPGSELLVDLVATRGDLAQLGIEAGKRLLERGQRRTLGLHAQSELM